MQKQNFKRKEFQIDRQFSQFLDKDVLVVLKNKEELNGTVISIDNYLNIVLMTNEGLRVIKGGKLSFISIKENSE